MNVYIKIYPEYGEPYDVSFMIDSIIDDEEQVDAWIDENLKNVCYWVWR